MAPGTKCGSDHCGAMAIDLVIKWGMVAAVCDGEDSCGRAKLRLMTPDELVDRAMETARQLTKALTDTGHMVAVDINSNEYKTWLRSARGF
jgi:UTP-glucose-1-phosphate uridylyltransferase